MRGSSPPPRSNHGKYHALRCKCYRIGATPIKVAKPQSFRRFEKRVVYEPVQLISLTRFSASHSDAIPYRVGVMRCMIAPRIFAASPTPRSLLNCRLISNDFFPFLAIPNTKFFFFRFFHFSIPS